MASRKTAEAVKADHDEAAPIPEALLDFTTDDEIAELVRLAKDKKEAETEAAKLTEKAQILEQRASELHRLADMQRAKARAALVAEALGEAGAESEPDAEPTRGPGSGELKEAAVELRRRAEAKQRDAAKALDAVRDRVLRLVEVCAHRCSAEYLQAARRLARLHAAIGGAQVVLDGVQQAGKLVSPMEWHTSLLVPTSAGLEALRNIGVEKHSGFRPPLVGGSETALRAASQGAYDAARSEITSVLGFWPFARRG